MNTEELKNLRTEKQLFLGSYVYKFLSLFMKKSEARKRAAKLENEINELRYRYHVLDDPSVTDEVYDSLTRELRQIEQAYPDLMRAGSPTQRIGGKPLEKFEKVRRDRPMLSLNDAFSEEDVLEWHRRLKKLEPAMSWSYFCDVKYDGLAIELIYERGEFKQASTRGDGLVGEDVTANIRTVESVPMSLKKNDDLIVRGEVLIFKAEFERINKIQTEKGDKVFVNPRNAAAGSVRQKNPRITASRKLEFRVHGIVSEDYEKYPTHESELKFLKSQGFEISPKWKTAKSISEAVKFYNELVKTRDKLPFEIDGVVIRVNENRLYNDRFGVVGKAPRAAIAFKFPGKKATTLVEDVTVQVGRTGKLTPVAILKPVEVGGVTVSRATLHNFDEIKRLGLKIGDTVVVNRAGDVIPKIEEVLPKLRSGAEKAFVVPKKCPVCDGGVERSSQSLTPQEMGREKGRGRKRLSVDYFCTNPKCFVKNKRGIRHFTSKAAFNIEGLGPKIIDKFIEEGLITDASDLFDLKPGDISPLERFAEKSAENIYNSIQGAKQITLPRFIYALGIPQVGEQTAIDLSEHFGSLPKLRRAKLEELERIENIGSVVAVSIYSYFNDKQNQEFVDRLLKKGVRVKSYESRVKSIKLKGLNFVVTGTLESMSREQAKAKIREHGGHFVSAVSKNTDYVVAGENPGSKLQKAERLGVKVIDEKEFLRLIK